MLSRLSPTRKSQNSKCGIFPVRNAPEINKRRIKSIQRHKRKRKRSLKNKRNKLKPNTSPLQIIHLIAPTIRRPRREIPPPRIRQHPTHTTHALLTLLLLLPRDNRIHRPRRTRRALAHHHRLALALAPTRRELRRAITRYLRLRFTAVPLPAVPVDGLETFVLHRPGGGGENGATLGGVFRLALARVAFGAGAAAHGLTEQAVAGERVEEAVDPAAAGEEGAGDAVCEVAGGFAMAGHAPHARGGEGEGQHDVDERVQHHQGGDAVDGVDGFLVGDGDACRAVVGGEEGAGFGAEAEEGYRIEDDEAEFGEEQPEVVQGQTLGFVLVADPAPGAGAHEVVVLVHAQADDGEKDGDDPQADDDDAEGAVGHAAAHHGGPIGVQRDGEHKKGAGDITEMDEDALRGAAGRRGEDGVFGDPVEADEEGGGLQEVGEDEVEEE